MQCGKCKQSVPLPGLIVTTGILVIIYVNGIGIMTVETPMNSERLCIGRFEAVLRSSRHAICSQRIPTAVTVAPCCNEELLSRIGRGHVHCTMLERIGWQSVSVIKRTYEVK